MGYGKETGGQRGGQEEGGGGRAGDRVRGRNSKGECWEMGERAPR